MTDEVLELAGRVGPHRESHEPKLNALNYLTAAVQPVSGYIKWSILQPIGSKWGMAYNADLGCCGFSAWQHYNAAKAAANGEDWKTVRETTWLPTYARLDAAYYAYGIAQGEAGPHPDQGVSNAAMLAWAYKNGFIDGYLEVPVQFADWFAMTFHGAIVGQVLDGDTAINDFNARPRRAWRAMGKSDGHDTLLAEGDGVGGGAEITWGGVEPFDVTYRENNWTDVWVIIDKEDPNIDQVALAAILTEMHGVVSIPAAAPALLDPSEIEHDIINVFDHAEHFVKPIEKIIEEGIKREGVQVVVKALSLILKDVLHSRL